MRRALMWLNVYGREAVRHKLKNSQKNTNFQSVLELMSDSLKATSMPFVSINPTNPRTNLWNFRKIFLRIGDFEKLSFFESGFQKIPCYAYYYVIQCTYILIINQIRMYFSCHSVFTLFKKRPFQFLGQWKLTGQCFIVRNSVVFLTKTTWLSVL